jgi:hypothetical protein
MKTNQLVLFGALGVGAYLLLSKSGSSNPLSSLVTNSTSTNPTSVQPYTQTGGNPDNPPFVATLQNIPLQQQYNPNLLNPNYRLTPIEIQNYLSNYLDLQQGLQTWIGNSGPGHPQTYINIEDAAQSHWQQYGVSENRTFIKLQTPSMDPFRGDQNNGGGFWSSIGNAVTSIGKDVISVAPAAATAIISNPELLAGVAGNDLEYLNGKELETIVTGSVVIKDLLPDIAKINPYYAGVVDTKINGIITYFS